MVLQVEEAHKVRRVSLVFLASKAPPAKAARWAPEAFRARAAGADPKVAMEKTAPKE